MVTMLLGNTSIHKATEKSVIFTNMMKCYCFKAETKEIRHIHILKRCDFWSYAHLCCPPFHLVVMHLDLLFIQIFSLFFSFFLFSPFFALELNRNLEGKKRENLLKPFLSQQHI